MLCHHVPSGNVQVFGGPENEVSVNRRRARFFGSGDPKNLLHESLELTGSADLHQGLEGVAFHLETCFQYGADCPLPLFRHLATLLDRLTGDGGLSSYRELEAYLVMVRSDMSTDTSHILFRAMSAATRWLTMGRGALAMLVSASARIFLVSLNLGLTDEASLRSRERTDPTASLYIVFTEAPIFWNRTCCSFGTGILSWVFSATVTE